MSLEALVIISCNEDDPQIDPSNYFNLAAPNTQVIKTPGGRVENSIDTINDTDQSTRIGMIVVLHHTNCPESQGDIDSNVRTDMQSLKSSEDVRNEIHILGYVLDTETKRLREVHKSLPSDAAGDEERQNVLNQMGDFSPFFS